MDYNKTEANAMRGKKMAENCNHDCAGCPESGACDQKIERSKLCRGAKVRHVIGIVSGKGGVGKSFVTAYLAVLLQKKGYRVGILDADITGPSIPKAFGITAKAVGADSIIYPARTDSGIQVISSEMLLEDSGQPIIWRGPMVAGLVEQFYEDTFWQDVDFLLVDMPPGTSDVPLTVLQKLPVEGLILVTTAQQLVSQIVEKAARMAAEMAVPVIGLVTNMAYVKCPHCGEKIAVYGATKTESLARAHDIPVAAEVPFDSDIASSIDDGSLERLAVDYLAPIRDALIDLANSSPKE